ncbi:MAG: 1-acyl-sn-glycerol-3-phosphate acyltransferase [Clostridia bacterium]|nr:1-acyl-sn-glycerol-3-phosphate acyltransferase [Clostridia bacterium]
MKSQDRLEVLEKIKLYEKEGKFDLPVENDPPAPQLMPDKVDYLCEKPFAKWRTGVANKLAIAFFEDLIKKGKIVIDANLGIENVKAIEGGAIITCNHFSIYDHYLIYRALRDILKDGILYKVIREGNYTGMQGFFGKLFRNCNTLPLSSNMETMKLFLKAVSTLLDRGEKILVYPEQEMWWNYRKPRPMKPGAFKFAVKNNVPIIPAFITLRDTDKIGDDGFNIQGNTVHFLPAIYPKPELSVKDNERYLMEENYKAWKKLYEETYNIPLEY